MDNGGEDGNNIKMEEAEQIATNSKKPAIRHAEKRRTATCTFADRVAQCSIDHYRNIVPKDQRPSQTCLATIVAHEKVDGKSTIHILGLGVGTKFLSESCLRKEISSDDYGRRIRDSHAEVLARRSFCRHLMLEVLENLQARASGKSNTIPHDYRILMRCENNDDNVHACKNVRYRLRPGVTLHLYASSAPCGNATLKKFSKMSKTKFRNDLKPDEWPSEPHTAIPGHSIQLGQFALLVKKDNCNNDNAPSSVIEGNCGSEGKVDEGKGDIDNHPLTNAESAGPNPKSPRTSKRKRMRWPALFSDDWAPPGTTIVSMNKGSIHTCSDKICRWNYLGLQGTLLASMLESPLYLSTVTVGRKFTECICRRAVCCRMGEWKQDEASLKQGYRSNHPAVLGTAAYMDEAGVVETNARIVGQDVRFHSSKSWAWWPGIGSGVECIDGNTGFLVHDFEDNTIESAQKSSLLSTYSLVKLFFKTTRLTQCISSGDKSTIENPPWGLSKLREIKIRLSSDHEIAKDYLFTKHKILRQWKRRSNTFDR